MSNLDEQAEELEVLASIYPSEFEKLESDTRFKILLRPDPDGQDNHVMVSLVCEMSESYPSEAPLTIKIVREKGLSDGQLGELQGLAERAAEENTGIACAFIVAEAVKEWLIENNHEGQDGSMYSEMMRRMQQKETDKRKVDDKEARIEAADSEFNDKNSIDPEELERIRKRQAGVAVTVESFMAWKRSFDAEMAARDGDGNVIEGAEFTVSAMKSEAEALQALIEQPIKLHADGRPTGKQFFLLAMQQGSSAGVVEEDPDADLDDNYDGEVFKDVAGKKFEDMDYEDEDDDDDDDDEYDPEEESADHDDDDD